MVLVSNGRGVVPLRSGERLVSGRSNASGQAMSPAGRICIGGTCAILDPWRLRSISRMNLRAKSLPRAKIRRGSRLKRWLLRATAQNGCLNPRYFGTRMEVHGFLKQHGVYLHYDVEDLERDKRTAEKLRGRLHEESASDKPRLG